MARECAMFHVKHPANFDHRMNLLDPIRRLIR
jgi:hypothetical protein